MTLTLKLIITVIIALVGAVIFGVLQYKVGRWQYIFTAIEVAILYYVWILPLKTPEPNERQNNASLEVSRHSRGLLTFGAAAILLWGLMAFTGSGILVWYTKIKKDPTPRTFLICYYFIGTGIGKRRYIFDVRDIAYRLPPTHKYKSILKRNCPLIKK